MFYDHLKGKKIIKDKSKLLFRCSIFLKLVLFWSEKIFHAEIL